MGELSCPVTGLVVTLEISRRETGVAFVAGALAMILHRRNSLSSMRVQSSR